MEEGLIHLLGSVVLCCAKRKNKRKKLSGLEFEFERWDFGVYICVCEYLKNYIGLIKKN